MNVEYTVYENNYDSLGRKNERLTCYVASRT